MGSWTDLRPEQVKEYNALMELYKASKPYVSPLEVTVMVDLYKLHGFEIMRMTLVQCGLNNWPKVDKVKMLAGLFRRYGREKVEWAIERMNALENYSLDTVSGILDKSRPAHRTQKDKPAVVAQQKYPTADGLHTQATAQKWLLAKGKSLDAWAEYFELAGRDPEHNYQLYRLKLEYA